MKLRLKTTVAVAVLALAGSAFAQDADQSADQAKESTHKAWENSKDAASNGWDATKKGTKDAYNDAKQDTKDAYNSAHNKLAKAGTVRGTLTKVDDDSLTIKDLDGKEVSLKRGAHTRISDSAHHRNAMLEEGSEVRASYHLDKNGDKWARSVVITATPKASTLDSDHDKDLDQNKDQSKDLNKDVDQDRR